MPKKLIVGSPQAMDREPPLDERDIMDQGTARDPMPPTVEELADLDEEEDLFADTDVPLLHDGNVIPFCVPIHRLRCDNSWCWCNNPQYRSKTLPRRTQ